MSFLTRFLNVFRRGSVEREFDEELRFHLDKRIESNLQAGLNAEEAEAEAYRQFGSIPAVKRGMREARIMKASRVAVVVAVAGVVGAVLWLRTGESPPSSPTYYRASDEGITRPSVVFERKPDYPDEAKQAKIQGSVFMECVVQTSGVCDDIRVAKSLDSTWLDGEAVKALQEWRFRPGTRMGKPVPVLVNVEFSFTLRR